MAKRPIKSSSSPKQERGGTTKSTADAATGAATVTPGDTPRKSLSIFATLRDTQRALQIVFLAALYAPISQLNISPVYGEIPSGYYHRYGLTASFLAAVLLRGLLPPQLPRVLTAFCFWVPTMQFILFQFSSVLGNPWGPLVTECLTCYPVVLLSIYIAMHSFDEIVRGRIDPSLAEVAPSMALFLLFSILHQACKGFIASVVGPGFLRSRIGMQLIIASLYGMVVRNSILWPCLPAVAITIVANPHTGLTRTTEVLNNTLALYDYTLLERKESITGYLSVLDNNQEGFRVMRCDHSLLGGEWKMRPKKGVKQRVGEPIYAIFVMLEAVQLAVPAPTSPQKTALNIGLGIGTAPSALIQHGINTTIMELDPVVHEFALKYFNFPQNHSHYIGDAVHAVKTANTTEAASYDYIIHDVFTGGAEPVELFTVEFLSGLHMLLKEDGVIAINYAGDLAMPASSLIYRTISSVFPSCRVFREDAAPAPGVKPEDFTNMVFFCRKQNIPVKFRQPVEADFLGSGSRREYLLPKHEIMPEQFVREGEVLRSGKTKELEKWHAKSALGHWKVMRTVLPAAVWETW